jgi:hypothetical protein
MKRWSCVLCLLALVSLALTGRVSAQAVTHPLDPLTRLEHFTVLEVLQQSGKLADGSRFTRLELKEPDKAGVWAWKPGLPIARSAEVVVAQGRSVFEATVDVTGKRLVSWAERTGVQPMWVESEYGNEVVGKVMKDPRFAEALKRRGITNSQFVTCIATPPGNFGEPKYAGKRIGVLSCRLRSGYRNTWARRIEGLSVVMDMHAKEILEFTDDEAVPVPAGGNDFDRAAIGKLREFSAPLEVRQPNGPAFTMDGHVITWDRWRFHVRPDSRVGVIISTATWKDGDRERPVMYQGHLSEIFVPYMSAQKDWYVRTFIDAGEYSAGGLADTLSPGVDCPDYATYIDSVVPAGAGWPTDKPSVVCVFERTAGDMIWRHGTEGRPQRELVVRMVAMIGNYDYVVDWRFLPDGQIKVSLGATGIVETKMASARDARVARRRLWPLRRAERRGRQPRSLLQLPPRHGRRWRHQPLRARRDRAEDAAARTPAPQHLGDRDQGRLVRAGGEADDGHAQAVAVARDGLAAEPRRVSRQLPVDAGPLDPHAADAGRDVAAARRLHRPPPVGHAVRGRRAVCRRRLPDAQHARPRPAGLDQGQPVHRRHRPRALVHVRHAPHGARRGVAGDAGVVARVRAAAVRLPRPQSRDGRGHEAVGMPPVGPAVPAGRRCWPRFKP